MSIAGAELYSQFEQLSFFHSYDAEAKFLTLRNATYLPAELFTLAEHIRGLDISGGTLTHLPAEFEQLTDLKILFASRNPFTELPAILGKCNSIEILGFKSCAITTVPAGSLPSQLKWLILTDNQITQLPNSIGTLTQLRKLALAVNTLSSLPVTLQNCTELELLRLGANAFTQEPPEWVFQLPNLAWYGDAGNPFSQPLAALASGQSTDVTKIPWDQLEQGELLGSSPSSSVYQGKYHNHSVALKLYHSEYTSDGYAIDDMNMLLAAGSHHNLPTVQGVITGHPERLPGVVLELIPPEYSNLGLPPSFETITRDTYPPQASFTAAQVSTILNTITKALQHAHANGVQHGDVYAHNILTAANGSSILTDFGAASLMSETTAKYRIAMDTRALNYLAHELQTLMI